MDRKNFDWWDKFSALPRYAFLLGAEGTIYRAEFPTGLYVDVHSVKELASAMQEEINELRAKVEGNE